MNTEESKVKSPSKNQFVELQDGFSSEEQHEQEILYEGTPEWDDVEICDNEKIKMKLEPVREIAKKAYSLEPDMLNGWTPKGQLAKPIPMTFKNYAFDSVLDYSIQAKRFNESVLLCYLGPRYETTYYAWYDKEFSFPYQHLSAPKNIKITDRFLCGQHWDAEKPGILFFDSLFESGNLDCAFKVGEAEYDLFMRVDSNTKGHLQWYNFKVKNMQRDKTYKLTICNFLKGKSLYSRGMRPYYFSIKKYLETGISWRQLETQCTYRKKVSKSEKILQFDESDSTYHLTFTITAEYENDEIQLAYCIPYTYSYLNSTIKRLEARVGEHPDKIMKVRRLCSSLGGLDLHQVTITSNVEEEEKHLKNKIKLNKKVIFITGRCHPGESNGSWMVEGLLQFLTGNSESARFLRGNAIFKIIPMLNPDGVVIGNYRTGLTGRDFNRQFAEPDKQILPEVYFLKQMFWNYKQLYQQDAFMYIDFHGHSVKKNVFAYGPEYPIIHKNYYESRMIPKLIASKSSMFRYYSCIFKIAEAKQTTGRAIFLKNMRIPFTFTIEASNGSYYDQITLENNAFDAEKWKQVGGKIIEGISEYLQVLKQLEKIRQDKMTERKRVRSKNGIQRMQSKKLAEKGNNSKQGYCTSMGFRRTKKNFITSEPNITLADFIATGDLKTKGLGKLLEQIKNQNQDKVEHQIQSDDEISQGKSDSEGSRDDLDRDEFAELIHRVKARKGPYRHKSMKTEPKKEATTMETGTLKTMYNDEDIQQQQDFINRHNHTKNNKEISIKKYLWKKKSSIGSTPSPKKQELATPMAAKIVTFNFSLKPLEMKGSSSILINEEKKTFTRNQFDNESSFTDLHPKKAQTKPYEFSQTFKKTFVSVQKQIMRRDSHKRYLVTMNNSASKQKSGIVLENVRGKRIGRNEEF